MKPLDKVPAAVLQQLCSVPGVVSSEFGGERLIGGLPRRRIVVLISFSGVLCKSRIGVPFLAAVVMIFT